jgi:DNA invertase Pin-like site-specific DNA recombinase
MKLLPKHVNELEGLRAARWVRESTRQQYDAFGPDSQREHQDRAIGQFGMIDTGIEWMVAASGWKDVWTTSAFCDMLDRAGSEFDVLVVPYFSRFMRNIKQALVFRDEIHARGAVVYICDERILSSDEHGWDEWVREAHDAEAFSRKQSRRVGEGCAAKRRRLGVPGGNRPPLGYIRARSDPSNPRSPQQLIEDPDNAPVVRRAFELSASGMTDREVAVAVGLKLTHVREILNNPVYFGRLRTGEDSGGPPLVTRALWDAVAVVRGKYSRRHRGPVSRRTYALSTLLVCAACGRRLTGHVGRYRHVDACADFKAAKPTVVPWRSPGDRRLKGESYKVEVYDNLVPRLLARVSVGAGTMTQVVGGLAIQPGSTFTMARIERDREAALRKYRQDRDTTALERTMKRLDEEEREAQASTQVISAAETVAWLRDLPALWAAADDWVRRLLTEALFEKVEVLGVKSVITHPTPEADAHGWSEAFGPVPHLIPVEMVAGAIGTDGRGERI